MLHITSDITIHVKWYYKSRQWCYISRQILQYMSSGIISHVKGVTYHVRYFNTCQVVLYVTSKVLHVTLDISIMSSGIISHVKGVTYHVRYFNTCQVVI